MTNQEINDMFSGKIPDTTWHTIAEQKKRIVELESVLDELKTCSAPSNHRYEERYFIACEKAEQLLKEAQDDTK